MPVLHTFAAAGRAAHCAARRARKNATRTRIELHGKRGARDPDNNAGDKQKTCS